MCIGVYSPKSKPGLRQSLSSHIKRSVWPSGSLRCSTQVVRSTEYLHGISHSGENMPSVAMGRACANPHATWALVTPDSVPVHLLAQTGLSRCLGHDWMVSARTSPTMRTSSSSGVLARIRPTRDVTDKAMAHIFHVARLTLSLAARECCGPQPR